MSHNEDCVTPLNRGGGHFFATRGFVKALRCSRPPLLKNLLCNVAIL